uniref:UDP-glucuronosyltransferase n=1 Tax=Caenorhabditis japonica TaxID=281687 RepID=A0A8R1HPP6_CAEJA
MNLFLLLSFSLCAVTSEAYNFLVVSPVFGYSHMKFMNKVADTLANGGHNVTVLQIYLYEHFGVIRMAKNKNVEIRDYHGTQNSQSNENSASDFKYMWNTEIINNPISGAIMTAPLLFEAMKPMCEKVLLDKELHEWILSKKFDGIISETFDFCGLYLGDHLKLNIIPMHSATKSLASDYAIGETSALNFLPSMRANYASQQTVIDRVSDIISMPCQEIAIARLFEKQYHHAHSLLNGDVRHWKEILQTATFYFSNGNDYLAFPTPSLPKHIHIGGFTIDPPKSLKLDEEYDRILSLRQSTVLISFGTVIQSADMPDNFKEGIVKMLHNLPETTFIWKYEVDDVDFANKLPKNVVLKKWLPQTALLSDSRLKLFITHGGLGSTLELAYSGMPALMIPVFGDQLLNAKMLVRHGGAQSFDKYDLENAEKLTEAVRDLISNDEYQKNAHLVADLLRNQPIDPKQNLLKHVEFAARFGRVESLEPYNVHYNFIQYYMLDAVLIIISVILFVLYLTHLIIKIVFPFIFKPKSKKE